MITRPIHLTVQDFYSVHLSASNVASIYLSDDYLLRFGDAMLGLGSGVEPVTKCVAVTGRMVPRSYSVLVLQTPHS